MRRSYHSPHTWQRGRIWATFAPDRLSLPRIALVVEGPECVVLSLNVSTDGCDPALGLDITLTAAGRIAFEAYWWVRERFGRKK